MRMLITGAGGMLGHDLAAAAARAGWDVVPLAHTDLDIADRDSVDSRVPAEHPDVVVNCAAWTDVDGAEQAEDAATAINGEGAGNVARAAGDCGAWTIHISSDYVFDGRKRDPYVESDLTNPASAYGHSKLAGERAVAQNAPASHTIVRSSWLFGTHGRCFPATILRLAAERDELDVVDDQHGCPTFTAHLAQGILELADGPPRLGSFTWRGRIVLMVRVRHLHREARRARLAGQASVDGGDAAAGHPTRLQRARHRARGRDRAAALAAGH